MPYITKIVDYINSKIIEEGGILDNAKYVKHFNGIAKFIPIGGENQPRIPLLYSIANGEQFAGVDDRYSLHGYHRILNRKVETNSNNFGDSNNLQIETTTILLVCFCDMERIKETEYTISEKVQQAMPTILNQTFIDSLTGVQSVEVAATDIDNDSISLWTSEYNGMDYALAVSQSLFAINYQVVTHYNKSCLSNCDDC